MSEIVNPFEPFKFWASKPLNIALAYLENYAKDKKVLLDPFAGSGVFCYAALLKGMKAIYNDLCPYGLFLARNVIKPVDPQTIQKFYNEVLKRPLNISIMTHDKKVIIKKGTPIEEAIKWFYHTTCDHPAKSGKGLCKQETFVEYFIWDTEYCILKKEGDVYATERFRRGDKRYRIFLDVVCWRDKIEINGKKKDVYIFNRKHMKEKWKEAFEKDPKIWIKYSKRGKFEPGIVNEIAAVLIRVGIKKGFVIRRRRYPILKKITCPVHKDLIQPLNNADNEKIKLIEQIQYPFPELIPNLKLGYCDEKSKKWIRFKTFRPNIFANEVLSTIENEEWKEKIPKLKNYFTKRNLIALNMFLWSITQVENKEIREQIYLIFIANLHKLAKFESLDVRWGSNNYFVQENFVENNVLEQISIAWRGVKKAKESVWSIFKSKLGNSSYDECWDPKEFVEHVNEPGKKSILWLRIDSRKINEAIKRNIIDFVFTDPPYRGEKESIQYFELTTFFTGWLSLDTFWKEKYGDFTWWKDEVIENDKQNKDLNKYFELLQECFKSVNKIVKRDAIWVITYHSPSKDVWEGVKKVLEEDEIGLKVPTYEEVMTYRIRAVGKGSFYVMRHGNIGEDSYIVLSKEELTEKETIKLSKKLSEQEFLQLVLKKMKNELDKNTGIITWGMFARHFPDIVLKYGGPYGETKSYKEFFESITIELGEESRILDRDKIGDELYKEIYNNINPEKLIRKTLVILGSKRGEISRSEMELKILPKINGRIDDALRIKMLKELFIFDRIGNKYIFKKLPKTLEKFLAKPKEKISLEEPTILPPEIIYKIKEMAKKYGGHIYKEMTGDFPLSVIIRGSEYLINIIDEASLRRYAMGTNVKERSNKIIVYINYSTKESALTSLAKQLDPAIFVVVPYEKYNIVIEAFRDYEPLDGLKKFIVRGR